MAGGKPLRPATPFAKADQMRIRTLAFEQSQIPPAGRVMFCRGRRILGHGDVAKLGQLRYIPDEADTIRISVADYPDVQQWVDGK